METEATTIKEWYPRASFPEWYRRLSNTFRRYLLTGHLADVAFRCRDGDSVLAHRMILIMASPMLRNLLSYSDEECEVTTVSLPDVAASSVKCFIESLYFGALPADSEKLEDCRRLSRFFCIDFSGAELKTTKSRSQSLAASELDTGQEIIAKPNSPPEKLDTDGTVKQFTVETSSQEAGGDIHFLLITNDASTKSQVASQTHQSIRLQDVKDNQNRACPVCGKKAIEHRLRVEDDGPVTANPMFVYRCCVQSCGGGYSIIRNAKVFNEHVKKKHGRANAVKVASLPKECVICQKPKSAHKNSNEKVKDPKKGHLYKCCKCSASKLSSKKFAEHTANHVAKKFPCLECGKGFSYDFLLSQHIRKEHDVEGRQEFIHCGADGCSYKSKYRQSMLTHKKEKHEGRKRSLKAGTSAASKSVICPSCNKTLTQWYYLHHHKKTCNTGSGTSVFQCEICQQSGFVNKTTLLNHVRARHSEERPFPCEYCPNKYATSMALSAHRARKHSLNKQGEFVPKKFWPCERCGKLLTSSTKLTSHIRTVHESYREWKCGFCDKKFSSKSNMKVHEGSAHTGHLPYKCEHCPTSFSRKSALTAHVASEHSRTGQEIISIMEGTSSPDLNRQQPPSSLFIIEEEGPM